MIDGFNVYYSVATCISKGNIAHGKWFDYRGYCEWVTAHNPNFSAGSKVHRVRLYSALAHHDPDPSVVSRHLVLNQAMTATNVEVTLGNFKRKRIRCKLPSCGGSFDKHEEKETDINVAMGVIESLLVDNVEQHQLPAAIRLPSGINLLKPTSW